MNLVVNGRPYLHNQVSEKIPPLDLLSWLDTQQAFPKVYWKSKNGQHEIAAIGKLLEFSSVPFFGTANNSPARFFGGKAFSDTSSKDSLWHSFPRSLFFLPACEITQDKNGTTLVIHSINHSKPLFPSLSFTEKKNPISITKRTDLPSYELWKVQVEDFLKNKEKMNLEKIVLARRTTFQTIETLSPFHLLSKLQQLTSNVTFFALQFRAGEAFIGATPEHLYQRKGRLLFSEAIAGTRPRGKTEEDDRRERDALMHSAKEQREFHFVKDYIQTALTPLCRSLTVEKENSILKTATVQHLHAPFHGELKAETTDEMLLNTLHPTPAVNGTPKQAALSYLQDIEPFNRGWYASALGWISQNDADFVVGIRSALIESKAIHLFSGGGIVEGSSPSLEWDEREHKIGLFKKVLS